MPKKLRIATYALIGLGLASQGCRGSSDTKTARFLEQGKQHLAKGDSQRALLAFRNAAQATPAAAEPQYQLGLATLAQGNVTAAVTFFQLAAQLDPKHIQSHLKIAELLAAGRDDETVRQGAVAARRVLTLAPDNPEAIATLALVDLRLGKAAEAEKAAAEALKKAPGHAGLAINLARSRAVRNDNPGAEQAMREALAAAPKSLELRLALAEFLLGAKRPDLAEAEYRRALEVEPSSGPALAGVARAQSLAGKPAEAEQSWRKLASGKDRTYSTSYAQYLWEQQKPEAALQELERVVKSDETDVPAVRLLVSAYLSASRVRDAAALLDRTLSWSKDDLNLLQTRAAVRLSLGEYDQAEADVQRLNKLQPASGQTHYLLSRILRARGDEAGRERELQKALASESGLAAARIELSERRLAGGKPGDALKLMDEAPAPQKQLLPVILQRNWALLAAGRRDEAAGVIAQILRSGRIPEALLQSAVVRLERGDFAGAKREAEEALAGAPDDVRALDLLAAAYSGLKQMDTGIARIREHVAGRPGNAPLRAWVGRLLLSKGRNAEARGELEAALAAAPHLTVTAMDLADLDSVEGKTDAARQRLTALLPQDQDGSIAARLGDLEHRHGDIQAAIQQYRRAVEINPRYVAALNNLAYLLADAAGKPDEALRYAQQAKDLAPDDPAVHDTLAWTYYQKGLYDIALRHFERGQTTGADPRRQYHLAMAYLRSGHEARGRTALAAALRANPGLPEAAAARKVLADVQAAASKKWALGH